MHNMALIVCVQGSLTQYSPPAPLPPGQGISSSRFTV
uniref:Uncharacterized protein n=1 Tax=Anguilla anguilla TaxID=7936 RepID=A0A0E9R8F1_ANGAN